MKPIGGLFLLLLVAGCAKEEGPPRLSLEIREIAVPADSASGEPFLIEADGRVSLSWIERRGEGHVMQVAHLGENAEGWEEPSTIAGGDNWFVNWADVPSIEARGEEMWAHWLEYNGDGRYSYGIRVAQSLDAGRSWSQPTWLHDDQSPAEHGFAALAATESDFKAVWLDGRKWAEGVEEMTVRTRSLGGGESAAAGPGPEYLLDDRTCDCCPNDLVAVANGGFVAAYRNRSQTEVRDIHVARFANGLWEDPYAVNSDGWEISACPVNGPALDAEGDDVVIAWFTAPDGDPQVNVAFSTDAGASFGPPIRIDEGGSIGRVDVVLLDDGSAIVTWIQTQGGQSTQDQSGIMARRVNPAGGQSEAVAVVPTSSSRASGYPRMARDGDDVVFAWTGVSSSRSVKSAIASLGD